VYIDVGVVEMSGGHTGHEDASEADCLLRPCLESRAGLQDTPPDVWLIQLQYQVTESREASMSEEISSEKRLMVN
jgi:hypothetical protein